MPANTSLSYSSIREAPPPARPTAYLDTNAPVNPAAGTRVVIRNPTFAAGTHGEGHGVYTPGRGGLGRQRSLIRPERKRSVKPMMRSEHAAPPTARGGAPTSRLGGLPDRQALTHYAVVEKPEPEEMDWWVYTSRTLTCCIWPVCLDMWGKRDPTVQQAWREKVALCLIILFIMFWVAFLTFGLQPSICGKSTSQNSNPFLSQSDHSSIPYRDDVIINGFVFDFKEVGNRLKERGNISLTADFYGVDITQLFEPANDACAVFGDGAKRNCSVPNRIPTSPSLAPNVNQSCPKMDWMDGVKPKYRLFFYWEEVAQHTQPPHSLMVYNGAVLNVTSYVYGNGTTKYLDNTAAADRIIPNLGKDGTLAFSAKPETVAGIRCLQQRHLVGFVDNQSVGCAANQIITTIVLSVIMGVVLVRFVMALAFHWVVSAGRTTVSAFTPAHRRYISDPPSKWRSPTMAYSGPDSTSIGMQPLGSVSLSRFRKEDTQMHALLLVTCYSEGSDGIRTTLDSLASTTYDDQHKLLFVIADGLIKGEGNEKTTPDLIVEMMDMEGGAVSEAKEYIAVADGSKQCNRAIVYSGFYRCGGHRVPMITVVKCGAESENGTKKPGNRGKRDSQLVLMNFLSRVMFNHRMTPLDYTLFTAIKNITGGVHAGTYEVVLMVDADTRVSEDSLTHMINAMANDDKVMGLCGETRIANKSDTWVSMIQVFEYYISHHLGKAFESMFGGVTCLPGCFCMYRIKVRKGLHATVPILVNPDILDEYCENVVDTLHKKNLLLLGEDRFLTTLMLRSFPKRKMIFVPQALCHTVVPDEFKVLLSQRRRWINSTIHNLLELVKLRDLCGIFCFSMQFVIALELIGTVVLPAAITFALILILSAIFSGAAQTVPLLMLAATLGLPGVLIIITTRKLIYVAWMFIYLLALPIWNFVLPVYAFWHFDDFTWGETRKVEGEGGQKDHSGRDGKFDPASVPLKEWAEWEALARMMASPPTAPHRRSLPEIPTNVTSTAPAVNTNRLSAYGGNAIVDTYTNGTWRDQRMSTSSRTAVPAPAPDAHQSANYATYGYTDQEVRLPGSWRGQSTYQSYAHHTLHTDGYHAYRQAAAANVDQTYQNQYHHTYAYGQQVPQQQVPDIAVQPPTPAKPEVQMNETYHQGERRGSMQGQADGSTSQGVSAAVARYWESLNSYQAAQYATQQPTAPKSPATVRNHNIAASNQAYAHHPNNIPQTGVESLRANAADRMPPQQSTIAAKGPAAQQTYQQEASFMSEASFSFASTVESIPEFNPAPPPVHHGSDMRNGYGNERPVGQYQEEVGPSGTRPGTSSRPRWR